MNLGIMFEIMNQNQHKERRINTFLQDLNVQIVKEQYVYLLNAVYITQNDIVWNVQRRIKKNSQQDL